MPKTFDVTQAYVSLVAEYSEPLFKLFTDPTTLYRELLQRLGPFGLRLADMKVELGDKLADYHLACVFLNYSATLRFRAERIEIWFDLTRATQEQALAISIKAFESVVATFEPSFRSFPIDVALHGNVADTTAKDFLLQLVKGVPNLGPSLGAACVFYYGPEEARLSSHMTIDLSGAVKDALFFRYSAIWDGSKISPGDLLAALPAHVDHCLTAFGLSRKSEG